MPIWIENEARAAGCNVRQVHIDRVRAMGVSGRALAQIGWHHLPFGVASIRDTPNGHYEPDPAGKPAMIVPVTYPEYHEGVITPIIARYPIIDLIAFSTNRPAAWRWRTGNAWALGEQWLTEPTGEPVEIVANPITWLAAGGEATCILDWSLDSPAWSYLRAGPDLIISDRFLEAKLITTLEQAMPRPTIRRARHAA